jgi:hypothetical protein
MMSSVASLIFGSLFISLVLYLFESCSNSWVLRTFVPAGSGLKSGRTLKWPIWLSTNFRAVFYARDLSDDAYQKVSVQPLPAPSKSSGVS